MEAIILAGGKSKRMGFDKQLLAYNNQWLMPQLLQMVMKYTSQYTIISNTPELYGTIDMAPLRVLKDQFPDCGPVEGVFQAMRNARSPWLLVLPCDVLPTANPLINDFLNEVYKQHLLESSYEWIGCSSGENQTTVFPFLIKRTALDTLTIIWGLDGHRNRSLKQMRSKLNSKTIAFTDNQMALWQTFNEYEALIQAGGGQWKIID